MGSPARGNQGENRETLNGFEAPSSPFINGDVCVRTEQEEQRIYFIAPVAGPSPSRGRNRHLIAKPLRHRIKGGGYYNIELGSRIITYKAISH